MKQSDQVTLPSLPKELGFELNLEFPQATTLKFRVLWCGVRGAQTAVWSDSPVASLSEQAVA